MTSYSWDVILGDFGDLDPIGYPFHIMVTQLSYTIILVGES